MARIQQKNKSAKEKVNEVLQALEQLAVNYDKKSEAIDSKNKDIDNRNEDLQQKEATINSTTPELQQFDSNKKFSEYEKDLGEYRSRCISQLFR